MRWIAMLALGTLLAKSLSSEQKSDHASAGARVIQEVLAAEDRKDEAMLMYVMSKGIVGGEDLDRIYADDLIFVSTGGKIISKAQRMENLRAGNLKYISFGRDSYVVHVYGNSAVLTGRATSVVELNGKLDNTPREFTNVWVKRSGQWVLLVHHATNIADH